MRQLGVLAILEINPDRFDLLDRFAVEQLGIEGLPIRPGRRHTGARPDALRIEQVRMEPVARQSFGHGNHIDTLNAFRLVAGEGVALDATGPLNANQMPAASLGFAQGLAEFYRRRPHDFVNGRDRLGEDTHIGQPKPGMCVCM